MAEFIGNVFEWTMTNAYTTLQFIIDTWGVWAGIAAIVLIRRLANR